MEADENSYQRKTFENRHTLISNYIKNIENILQFHSNLISSRNVRLRKELAKRKGKLKSIDEEIARLKNISP